MILNALVHKDYSSNIPIQISVSDDKIYIANVGSLPDDWTVKRLLGKHSSRPHNPTIAGCVYLTGMIETWGRGIRKVFDECKKHGCPSPVYVVSAGDPGDILVRIDAAPDALLDTPDTAVASLGETINGTVNETVNETVNDQIVKVVKSNPGIRRPRLLKLIPSLTLSTLARRLAELSVQIEFRGAPKTGGYYVKK